jgi:hypothetical protein
MNELTYQNSILMKLDIFITVKANYHLRIATTIFRSHSELLLHKWPMNNGHLSTTVTIFELQRVVVVHKYDCILKLACQTHKIIPETMSASLGPTVWMFPMTTTTTSGTDINSTNHRSRKTGRILQKLFFCNWFLISSTLSALCQRKNCLTFSFFAKISILVSGRTFRAVSAERSPSDQILESVLRPLKILLLSFLFLRELFFLASSSYNVFFLSIDDSLCVCFACASIFNTKKYRRCSAHKSMDPKILLQYYSKWLPLTVSFLRNSKLCLKIMKKIWTLK